jgi:hypothetical protein
MGQGENRHKTSLYVDKIKDVKAPNWVTKYNLFRSTQGNTSPEAIRKEYIQNLNKWLGKNPKGTSDDFRKDFGIIIDEKGNELLTNDFKSEKLRALRERQQVPTGTKMSGQPRQRVDKPFFADFELLEGHHKKGLANLGVFFDGATPGQAFEMRQRMLNENFAGGKDKRNWAWLNKKQHDLTHKILGYATDAEIDDPKYKGVEFFDLDKPGKKGVPGFSDKFLKYLESVPFDRPDTGFGDSAKNWTGPIVTDFDDLADPSLGKGSLVNRGDLLMDYLRNTDEAFEKSVTQARKLSPQNLPLDKLAPDLAQTTGKKFGINNINPEVSNAIKTSKMLNGLTSATRRGETITRGVAAAATGNVVGATVAGGTLLASEALQSTAAQKAISKQIAKMAAKRGGKTALKAIPGLDVLISGKEAWDYAAQGKFDQAGIAALSGAIGWIPVIGDGASAALDFSNTGIDIARMDFNQKNKKKPDIDTNIKNRRTLTSGLKSLY